MMVLKEMSNPIQTGKLDNLGRVKLEREILMLLEWKAGQTMSLQMLLDGSGVVLRPSDEVCVHCGNANPYNLISVRSGSMICMECLVTAYEQCKK